MTNLVVTIDFETEEIVGALPPQPVGVSIKVGEGPSDYFAWGHPHYTGNNITKEAAANRLDYYFKCHPILMHNAAFDLAVARHHMMLAPPKVIHDTMILLFLRDPHAATLALKPSADLILQRPPEEQDRLHDWILANIPGATKNTAGKFISLAPAHLVRAYANADVEMTYALFNYLYDKFKGEAYDREMQLLPILLKNTLKGVRIDAPRLEKDYNVFSHVKTQVDARICTYLGKNFSIDSAVELADAIDAFDPEVEWVLTKTGKRSTSKPNLLSASKDKKLLLYLNYRQTLTTYLDTFFYAWLTKQDRGRLHFNWNQVRHNESGSFKGTRTGRLSSNPSMLNVPNSFVVSGDNAELFKALKLPPLPTMRSYLLPEEGQSWIKRDYASQEVRVLAHYENGTLMKAFQDDPYLDMHQYMSDAITEMLGRPITRRAAKTILFSILYGAGLTKLSEQLACSYDEASEVKRIYLKKLPGVKTVQDDIASNWAEGRQLMTFGNRGYWKEPSREMVDRNTGLTRIADFGYKGLNYLIQGSSADITKQAIINYDKIKKDGVFLLSVHDEINISGPLSEAKVLDEAMLDIPLDIKLISDGHIGQNYGSLTPIQF